MSGEPTVSSHVHESALRQAWCVRTSTWQWACYARVSRTLRRCCCLCVLSTSPTCVFAHMHATISISSSGLEITTESSHAVQAHAYLYASIFARYEFTPPEDPGNDDVPFVCFELKLDTLVAALTLLENIIQRHRGDASVELTYDGVGYPLTLSCVRADRMSDGRLHTRFQLQTLDAEAIESLGFDAARTAAHVIVPSEWLSYAFQDIEASGDAYVRVRVTDKGRRSLVLSTSGTHGSAEIELPDTDQLTERFECGAQTDNWYPLTCISDTLAALRSSIKTSLRADMHGMLSLQFMVASSRAGSRRSVAASGHAFVEFLVRICSHVLSSGHRSHTRAT